MLKRYLGLLLLSVWGQAVAETNCSYDPLYAGTLLAFIPENIEPKQIYISSYLSFSWQNGNYTNDGSCKKGPIARTPAASVLIETGITSFLDISLNLGFNYSQTGHFQSLTYQDTQAFLGWQILLDTKGSWIPDLRFLIGENFPTGSYQNLNPQKYLTDSSGVGCYQTLFVLVMQKIFYNLLSNPFNINLNLEYILSTKTNVHGFSIYGGDPSTKGTISVGDLYIFNFAFEYSLSRNWVIGSDIRYNYQNSSSFSGHSQSEVGIYPSNQFSLAPCIEYNPSWNFNITLGAWFTLSGKNTPSFITPILSLSATF